TRFPVWEWDGTTWLDRTSPMDATWPPPLQSTRAAYDSDRHVTVIFGGSLESATPPASQETWEWNGTTFTKRETMRLPSPRDGHAMTYDPVHKVTLVFGG